MEDDDDFTFPTTVAAVTATAEERGADVADMTAVAASLPGSAAPGGASSRLWPFAAPITPGATTTTASLKTVKKEDEEAPAARQEEERAAVVDDEDRMDMLWDDTATTTAPPASRRSGVNKLAEPPEPRQPPAPAKPAHETDERAAAVAEQERMDLLWESFNEELLLRRTRSNSKTKQHYGAAVAPGPPPEPDLWYLCPSSDESEDDAASSAVSASSPRYGCAPTMLRAGGWALLLRLFRRLFAVDKAPPPPRRHGNIYVP